LVVRSITAPPIPLSTAQSRQLQPPLIPNNCSLRHDVHDRNTVGEHRPRGMKRSIGYTRTGRPIVLIGACLFVCCLLYLVSA
jgi:hypothetical protein